MGCKEVDLINQLSEEFGMDLEKRLQEDIEPEEDELNEAIGGEEYFGLLCESFRGRIG